ncbi:MAG: MarR family winged helix-turn-helix transcriptional regulator [Hyphomicrobium sp.]
MPKTTEVAADEKDFDVLRLDSQLCFALYAATRAIAKTYRQKLEPIGLTYPQYLVLLVLWEQDGLTVTEIGKKLRLDSGTLTPLLQRLEAMELLKRRRNAEDERVVQTFLTAKGEALKTGALDARRYVACQLGMTESQILALRSDLMALVAQLDEGVACEAAE